MTPPVIMGILNVTPDSFSGDGILSHPDYIARAVAQAERMATDGATMIDIGGESTRPGFTPVEEAEEIRRVVPVIAAIHKALPSLELSIDTTKAAVAERALDVGAMIINDISALTKDPALASLAAKSHARVVLMHNKAQKEAITHSAVVGGQYEAPSYEDVVQETSQALKERIAFTQQQGIDDTKIILDPGIGFGKTPQQNMQLIAKLDQIKALGYPVLMALSRKSFIGHTLNLPPEDRLEGTAASIAIAVLNGADILRVHDVKAMARVAAMAAAIRLSAFDPESHR